MVSHMWSIVMLMMKTWCVVYWCTVDCFTCHLLLNTSQLREILGFSHLYSRRSASECNGVVSCAPVSQARPTYRHLQETVVPGHQWLDHAVPSRPHQQPPARGWFRLVTSYQRVWCGGRSLGPSCPGISLLIVNFISYFNKQMLLEILGIKNTMIIMATPRRPVAHQCENWDNNCIKSVWSSISSTRPTAAGQSVYWCTMTTPIHHHTSIIIVNLPINIQIVFFYKQSSFTSLELSTLIRFINIFCTNLQLKYFYK